MSNTTNHLSFILKPSTIAGGGVGVFAIHDIEKGTRLDIYNNDFDEKLYDLTEIPEELQAYCVSREGGKIQCPKFFNRMGIGNYLNHSNDENAHWDGKSYFAKKDIKKGEEIFADYNELGEPEETKAPYYKA